MRIEKVVNGETVVHIWDGGNIVLDVDGDDGAVIDRYIRGITLLASEDYGYYLFNAHGDVVQLADGSGAVTKDYDYDAFGVQLDSDGQTVYTQTGDALFADVDANPWRYCGEYFDTETNTIYLRARYYDPVTGRFSSEDPIRDGLNWYTYCIGNPIIFIDPWGLAPTPEEALTMTVHLYQCWNGEEPDVLTGGWEYLMYKNPEKTTVVMGFYHRLKGDGTREYAVVNKGTNVENIAEWLNNFMQPFGLSVDMWFSIELAKEFNKKHTSEEITFIGHSKGGAEATANAVATNRGAILFNPMAANLAANGLFGDELFYNNKAGITAYIVKGDILNGPFSTLHSPVVRMIYLDTSAPTPWWKTVFNFPNGIENHLPDAIRNGLIQHKRKEGEK